MLKGTITVCNADKIRTLCNLPDLYYPLDAVLTCDTVSCPAEIEDGTCFAWFDALAAAALLNCMVDDLAVIEWDHCFVDADGDPACFNDIHGMDITVRIESVRIVDDFSDLF